MNNFGHRGILTGDDIGAEIFIDSHWVSSPVKIHAGYASILVEAPRKP